MAPVFLYRGKSMKQKILKGLKIVVIVVCVVTMAKCLFNSDARPIYNWIMRDFYWDFFVKEIGEDRKIVLHLYPNENVSELCVNYDEKKLDCRKIKYSDVKEAEYEEISVCRDYYLDYSYREWNDGWGKRDKSEYYYLELPDSNKVSISSDEKTGVRLYVYNYFHKFSCSELDIALNCNVNHIEFEIDDEGVLVTSESDLKDTFITLMMQDIQESIDYNGVYEYPDWEYGSTNNTINAIYIKMISERELKVFLDLDNDGEFEYECEQEKEKVGKKSVYD